MTSKEALDVAMNLADKAQKHIQFFILICTAFGGWVLVSKNTFSIIECALMVLVFSGAAIGLLLGELDIMRRLNAALLFASKKFELEEDAIQTDTRPLFAETNTKNAAIAMGLTILFVNAILATAWMRPPTLPKTIDTNAKAALLIPVSGIKSAALHSTHTYRAYTSVKLYPVRNT